MILHQGKKAGRTITRELRMKTIVGALSVLLLLSWTLSSAIAAQHSDHAKPRKVVHASRFQIRNSNAFVARTNSLPA
jgi:hypothetical protein